MTQYQSNVLQHSKSSKNNIALVEKSLQLYGIMEKYVYKLGKW